MTHFIRMLRSPVLALGCILLALSACSAENDTASSAEPVPNTVPADAPASPLEADAAVTISQDEGYLLFVSNEDSNNLSMISGRTHEVLATIDVGKRPRGMKVSPDGSRVYVALTGSPKCPPTMSDEDCEAQETDRSADGIAEVDVRNQRVLRVLESGENPEQFDVNWDTGRLYVSNEDISKASILDMASGEVLMQADTGREPEGVRLSPDGTLVYVTGEVDSDVTVLNAATGEHIASIPVGTRPRDSLFTRDGETAYVAGEFGRNITIIDVADNRVVGEIPLAEDDLPMELELSPDEQTLYVSTGRAGSIAAIDIESRTVTDTVAVGDRPWGLAISADGRFLYTANGPSDSVSVVDRESFEVVKTISVGETPWGVVVGPVPGAD